MKNEIDRQKRRNRKTKIKRSENKCGAIEKRDNKRGRELENEIYREWGREI